MRIDHIQWRSIIGDNESISSIYPLRILINNFFSFYFTNALTQSIQFVQ